MSTCESSAVPPLERLPRLLRALQSAESKAGVLAALAELGVPEAARARVSGSAADVLGRGLRREPPASRTELELALGVLVSLERGAGANEEGAFP